MGDSLSYLDLLQVYGGWLYLNTHVKDTRV